jgi:hypothetical protein
MTTLEDIFKNRLKSIMNQIEELEDAGVDMWDERLKNLRKEWVMYVDLLMEEGQDIISLN